MNKGQRVAVAVVCGALGLGIVAYMAAVVSPVSAFGALLALLVVEARLLTNHFPNDTLSEALWFLSSSHPMVPFLFGAATGAAIASGFIVNPWLVGGVMFLNGHFFFQSADVYKWIRKKFEGEEDEKVVR